ncbi:MAG: hypothetical protein PHT12_04270 [Patescibacteria group bacterium]|nr:hypothetical protein [Patescibacteria group bacterium]
MLPPWVIEQIRKREEDERRRREEQDQPRVYIDDEPPPPDSDAPDRRDRDRGVEIVDLDIPRKTAGTVIQL